jgi:hypothetical protein
VGFISLLNMGNKARFIGIAVAALTFATGCETDYSAPQSFTVSNDAIAQAVHDAIAGAAFADKLDGSPAVNCSGRTTCTISYTVKEPVGAAALVDKEEGGVDVKLVEPTRQVWKALFTDPQFRSGTFKVSGPVITIGGKFHTSLYYTLTCDRDAASQIDWDHVYGAGIRTLCDYETH